MSVCLAQVRHSYAMPGQQDRGILDIDRWRLEAGQQILLRGISGSGKTTLLNILAGLLKPTSGEVVIGTQPLYVLDEAARDRFRAHNIGYVFQTHLLIPNLSARENVEMPAIFAGQLARAARRQRATRLLAEVGLGEFVQHRPAQLSTGQRLRVAIARALVNEPRLLLADEPTAALDAEANHMVMDLLQSTCQRLEATLIVASHDPSLNVRFDEVFDLFGGRLQMTTHA